MDVHFNAYKVKYVKLSSFFQTIRNSQIVTSLNIFINLDDMFHNLHRPLVDKEFQICGKNASRQLLSNIFNLCGHYYNWAVKYQHLDVKIYAFYTSTYRSFKNSIYVDEYRKHFRHIMEPEAMQYYYINEAIRDAFPLLNTVSWYLPNIYLIDSKYIEPSAVPWYIYREKRPANWNLLISRDIYDYQYAYKDHWTVIAPRGNDDNVILTRDNLWSHINSREHIGRDQMNISFDYNFYNLAKSIVGDKYRNIPRLKRVGWKTLFKYMDSIERTEDSTQAVVENALIRLLLSKGVTEEALNNNLACVDVEAQTKVMMQIDRTVIDSQFVDITDYENLKELNRIKLYQYPLNLQQLCIEK